MLQAFQLSYEPHPLVGRLFHQVDLNLDRGDKVALVGPNGCGKTKLLEILSGRLMPTEGRVVLASGCRLGYLPQDFGSAGEDTLDEFLWRSALERGLQTERLDVELRKRAHRFGIDRNLLRRDYRLLSLGERMRAWMLFLQCEEPDALLLDEPTNHLDLEARLWLEDYLRETQQAVLMVCHDRTLMDAVAQRTLVLGRDGISEYAGGYSAMKQAKLLEQERQMGAYERHRAEDRRLRIAAERELQHAAEMTKRPTQRTFNPKAKAFYAGKQARLDKRAKAVLTRVRQGREKGPEKPFVPGSTRVTLGANASRFDFVLVGRDLSKSYGDRLLFGQVDLTIGRNDRLAIVGRNGCGKTTLLRLLTAEEQPDGGEFVWANDARIAALSQGRNTLDPNTSILSALDLPNADAICRARTLLGQLGIRGDDATKEVGVLSVGERTKVELASLLLQPVNVLLLDEPTNHLDVESLEALEIALREFPGAVIFTSHDRRFVEQLATQVLDLS